MRTVNIKRVTENLTLELKRDPKDWSYAIVEYSWIRSNIKGHFTIHSCDRVVTAVVGVNCLTRTERDFIRDSGYIIPF